jgi:hypothetical protein
VELAFSIADPQSVTGQLYTGYLSDPRSQVLDYSKGLKNVVNDNYVLLGEESTVKALPEFTCDVIVVPDFVFIQYFVSIPIQMGSKYTKPVKRELLKLINMGIVDRIKEKHFIIDVNHETNCAEREVGPLEYHNVLAPFSGLVLGIFLAFLLLTMEFVLRFTKIWSTRPKLKDSRHGQEMHDYMSKEKLARMKLFKVSTYLSVNQSQVSFKEQLDAIQRIIFD